MTSPAPQGTTPIRKSVSVPLTPGEAFTLWTEKMDRWWPLDTKGVSVGRGLDPSTVIRVEPRVGGQVVEELANGEDAVWGDILIWEPGQRFRMSWYPGRAADMPTEVEVTFTAENSGTRVDLVHSGFDAYASGAEVKSMYNDGWDVLVGRLFAEAALAHAPA